MIREPLRLESFDVEHVTLVASRHDAALELARRLRERLAPGCRVLVAVSGGADSLALTSLLLALQRRRHPSMIEPILGHVDHALRSSSAAEADFVNRVAERCGLSCVTRRLAWAATGSRVSGEQARERRWGALEEMAVDVDAEAILTAHHADDQAETILMRLARGTGLAGLGGIPEVRTTADGRLVLRPLLRRTRTELRALVQQVGLPWIDDPTNDDRRRTRERLRHEVLPALEAIHPGAIRHLAALAEECASPPPASIASASPGTTIDRDVIRQWPAAAVATHLRTVAGRLTGRPANAVPREVWNRAAAMVMDDERRRRRLRIDATMDLVVHRDDAAFELHPDPAEVT